MKISLLEPIGIDAELMDKLSAPLKEMGHEFVYYDNKTTDKDELLKRACDSEIVMIANNPLPDSVIEKCDKLKMLDVAFTGIDHVGQTACKAKDVMICNAAGYSNETVSELAVGMAIAVLRKIAEGDKAVRNGGTLASAGLMGTELNTKTVGIIGTGRIGIMTAKLFKAFGCKVIGYSRTKKPEAVEVGIEYMELDDVLKTSDIVSLHIPATAETKNSINYALLKDMPKGAMLVNTARKEVINEAELIKLMEERADFKYITDIMPAANAEFAEKFAGRYFSTPKKMGAQTAEANINAGIAAAQQIVGFLKDGCEKFRVNK